MFGSATPVNFSRNCTTDVWSNFWLHTKPPALHGDTMMHGTRKPPPMGRPSAYSSGVPDGAVGGTTWSNSPSFSS
jgi:hypothetical protein